MPLARTSRPRLHPRPTTGPRSPETFAGRQGSCASKPFELVRLRFDPIEVVEPPLVYARSVRRRQHAPSDHERQQDGNLWLERLNKRAMLKERREVGAR